MRWVVIISGKTYLDIRDAYTDTEETITPVPVVPSPENAQPNIHM
jgi:hypothetical protein